MRLGRTSSYSDRGDFLLAPRGDAALVHDGNGPRTRLVRVPTRAPVPSFRRAAIDSAFPYGRVRVTRFSDDGSRLLMTSDGSLAVADARTGAILRAHHVALGLPWDAAATLVAARFIPGDSGGVALVTTRSGRPGSALQRLDVRTGETREMARFDRVVDDVLLARDGRVWTRAGGAIALHDPSGAVLAWLLRGAGDAWLVTTPAGLYDTGGRGTELAAWRVDGRLVAIDRLGAGFRVPGLLARLLR